jgi:diguanylate cyclase (GGDEF)-like protein
MFLDLDRFKEINDRHGHAAGDLVLVEIADRLHHALREADSIGRFGGDEFVVVCDGLDDEAALARICARVQDGIARPYQLGPKAGTLSTSLGAVLEWDHGVLPLQLIERADALMYAAKRRGSRREILVHGRPGELTLRARSASALREAFEAGQLNLAYLPIIALESQETMMVEGLLRCQRAALSKLTPAELLELVEQTRLANRLDEWVLGGAAHGARLLREATGAPMRVVVNLSASQLANDTLPKLVADAARAHEIETRSLGFDIAERVIATNAPWLEPAIESLRALDSALFADDVLTPDVDVERFAALGFAGLKLDGSMIERSADDANFAARVQAMVRLTRSLGLFVIAERVEDERRLETARNLGCDMAQGYGFFGFPRPASELAKLIR